MVNETTSKFEKEARKLLSKGYTQGDLIDIVTEVVRQERMKRFSVGRSGFMPGSG
jgi:hypothetical protein